ncbi:hypothetical protein GGTG_01858 [Gaeumannomyces tritici R3-111a-1]|uniref:Uncharacterized protein n=1 Tax=Gaeumannomyces tritici (strain R3-111a-1) TaxID=644352 RepID=J3NKR7_GAET3|nr:hypothetical protein GGTG_01858 [Gaeumannomyces tritici R3-111a-1]EJT81884.1 hypothetical protein GGTG_01858 [Gaeumannomyces tritici R3-111a-1]
MSMKRLASLASRLVRRHRFSFVISKSAWHPTSHMTNFERTGGHNRAPPGPLPSKQGRTNPVGEVQVGAIDENSSPDRGTHGGLAVAS